MSNLGDGSWISVASNATTRSWGGSVEGVSFTGDKYSGNGYHPSIIGDDETDIREK